MTGATAEHGPIGPETQSVLTLHSSAKYVCEFRGEMFCILVRRLVASLPENRGKRPREVARLNPIRTARKLHSVSGFLAARA